MYDADHELQKFENLCVLGLSCLYSCVVSFGIDTHFRWTFSFVLKFITYWKILAFILFLSPNKKREYKNKKFGFGGQKKRSKYNTEESSADVSGFNARVAHGRMGKKHFKVLY